jgi:hypothetical protein
MNSLIEYFGNIQTDNPSFIAVVFQKSTAMSYPLAVSIAKSASKYYESQIGKRLIHCAMFDRKAESASAAVSLIECVGTLQGVQVWVLGEIVINPFNVSEVLKCYYTSMLCDDTKAHCIVHHTDKIEGYRPPLTISIDARHGVRTNIMEDKGTKYLIPCRRIDNQYGHSGLYEDHPASLEDQIQSMAVSKGCHWCPNFKKTNFKKL